MKKGSLWVYRLFRITHALQFINAMQLAPSKFISLLFLKMKPLKRFLMFRT